MSRTVTGIFWAMALLTVVAALYLAIARPVDPQEADVIRAIATARP